MLIVLLNETEYYRRLESSALSYREKSRRFQQSPFFRSVVDELDKYGKLRGLSGRSEGMASPESDPYVFFLNAIVLVTDPEARSTLATLPFTTEVWNGSRRRTLQRHGPPASATLTNTSARSESVDGEAYWADLTADNWGYTESGMKAYLETVAPRESGHGISVTVIDSGFDVEHPLYNPMWQGESFDPYHVNIAGAHYYCKGIEYEGDSLCLSDQIDDSHPRGHGTSDLGIVWQAVPNAYFHVAELPVGTVGPWVWAGPTNEQIIASFEYGKEVDSDVITTSFGLGDQCDTPNDGSMDVSRVASEAADADTVVVAAAGNSGCEYTAPPATGEDVIAVVGSYRFRSGDGPVKQGVSSTSSPNRTNGDKPDLAAPGLGVRSLDINGTSSGISGSSFAAPHVAGMAALLSRVGDAPSVRSALYSSAVDIPRTDLDGSGWATVMGAYGDEALAGNDHHPDPVTRVINRSSSGSEASFKVRLENEGEFSRTANNGIHLRVTDASVTSVALGGFDRCLAASDVSVSACEQRSDVPAGVIELYVDGDSATSGIIEATVSDPSSAAVHHRGWIRDIGDTTFNPYAQNYERYIARTPGQGNEIDPKQATPQSQRNPPFARAAYDDGFAITQYATHETFIGPNQTTVTASPATWEVGDVPTGETRQRSITLENTGDIGTDIGVSGGPGLSFSGVPGHLDAGASGSFSVTLDADAYDGDSIVVSYKGGRLVIPVSATVVNAEEYIREESESFSDENFCWEVDVWGPDSGIACNGDESREWVDTEDIDDEAYNGFVDATLDVEFATDPNQDAQEDPLQVYVNGEQITTLESPPGGGEMETRSISLSKDDLREGENEFRLKVGGASMYDIGQDTELRYSYLEEAHLELDIGEHPTEVPAGTTFRVPVTITNDGGQTAENVVLGLGGGYDESVIEVVKWPDGYGLDDGETLSSGQSDVRYFEFLLKEPRRVSIELAAASDADHTDESFTVAPPNDPPTLRNHAVSPDEATAGDVVTYTADVTDPDGDTVDLTIEVYEPADGDWRSRGPERVAGSGTSAFALSPFAAADEGRESKFRIRYDDGHGHSGVWGPFGGPTVVDDDAEGPTFVAWDYPTRTFPGEPVPVRVEISDRSGVVAANVSYTYPDGSTGNRPLTEERASWTATIPAPTAGMVGGPIRFTVAATDGDESSETASSVTRTINVREPNDPPVADAGADRSVTSGEATVLNGTASSDPNGDRLAFRWRQIDGPSVELRNVSAARPTLVAPDIDTETTVTLELTVTDSRNATASDTVAITIRPTNDPPTARLGANATTITAGDTIRLDASSSSDPNSDPLTYRWSVVSGQPTKVDRTDGAIRDLTLRQPGEYVIEVAVSDGEYTDTTTVRVRVEAATPTPTTRSPTTAPPEPPVTSTEPPSDGPGIVDGIVDAIVDLIRGLFDSLF